MLYYATKVTADNIDELIEMGAQHKFTLDHLQDQFEFNAEDGLDTYLILTTDEKDVVLTFNDINSNEFDETKWQFGTNTTGPFTQIVRI